MQKTAFLFPGQGSQSLALLSSLANRYAIIEKIFERASQVVQYDIWQLAQQGPIEKLHQTNYTQPLLLTAGFAVWQLWKQQFGQLPHFLAGYSLGEYTAYVCSGSIAFEDALQLVRKRAAYMQEAVRGQKTQMAIIIGLEQTIVIRLCHQMATVDQWVSPSNYNTKFQTIIAGHTIAVKKVMTLAKQKGAKLVKKIEVSVPSHCQLMYPAVLQLAKDLEKLSIQKPRIPVICNVHGSPLEHVNDIRSSLSKQLYQPVQWTRSINWLLNHSVKNFFECGPGHILTRLTAQLCLHPVCAVAMGERDGFTEALALSQ